MKAYLRDYIMKHIYTEVLEVTEGLLKVDKFVFQGCLL